MDRYWIRIALGALAVFVVGLGVWSLVGRGVQEVRDITGSDEAITIPLFGIMPFTVEGAKAGRIDRVTLLRDAPKRISGVVVRVGGDDSLLHTAFEGCDFTVDDPTHFNQNSQFRCLRDSVALAGLEGFGEVRIRTPTGEIVRRIFLPADIIRELRDSAQFDRHFEMAEEYEAEAERIADSLGITTEEFSDSLRAEVEAKVESAMVEASRRAQEATERAREAERRTTEGGTGARVEVGP
jgi:hypothetical protein